MFGGARVPKRHHELEGQNRQVPVKKGLEFYVVMSTVILGHVASMKLILKFHISCLYHGQDNDFSERK
jgi:hypothetical protein